MLKVLIADADIEAREQLCETIATIDRDARIQTADTGRELFRHIQESTFDILFLDMILPYTDVAKLREVLALMSARGGTRLVLVSERLRPNWTAIARHLHAYEVLTKPYRSHAIVKLIDTFREIRRPRQTLIVDPSARARDILRGALRESQFRVDPVEAESGKRAIRHARQQDFEIAFVSNALTDMPALEAACQLLSRSDERISVVLMDRAFEETHRALEIFGVKDVIVQPFDSVDVTRSLHGALGLWRPYLVNALAAERDMRRKEAVATKTAAA